MMIMSNHHVSPFHVYRSTYFNYHIFKLQNPKLLKLPAAVATNFSL
jgi:hypothetical protein